jgi:hypothetical protein
MIYLSISMKKILLLFSVLLTFGLFAYSQDVQFSPAVIPSGGGSSSTQAVNLSRWRIGQINVVTLPSDENAQKMATVAHTILPDDSPSDWRVTLFPNPVQGELNIRFDMDSKGEYAFEIFDVTGRKMITQKARIIFPGQITELDLSGLTPALYVLKIIPSGEGSHRQFKITKQ